MPPLPEILSQLNDDMRASDTWGDVAAYIPELARVDPAQFAIAVTTDDGDVYTAGDTDTAFSVQSITKVFTLAIALGRSGDQLWRRVGREPSGRAFNSIVQLEQESGRPSLHPKQHMGTATSRWRIFWPPAATLTILPKKPLVHIFTTARLKCRYANSLWQVAS